MPEENKTVYQNATTAVSHEKNDQPEFTWVHILFLTLCALSGLILFSTLLYYVVKKKRLDQLRHHLVPLYHFDAGECEDWEEELMEETTIEKDKKNSKYYRSMSSPEMTAEHTI
ncbi:hypothetical protein RUM43_011638 [Polyplax serrata]|uniref:Small integral membrane protein 29 n=1 Tax=Polyplax serrata TaxID=468196 RepID=A0AAN8S174_POLSC